MRKINPFKPNSPVGYSLFAGRDKQIKEVANGLYQTEKGNPYNFLITGNRGIGKTSFGKFIKGYAEGKIYLPPKSPNFICVSTILLKGTLIGGIVKSTIEELESQLLDLEPVRGYWKKFLDFVSRVNFMGSSYTKRQDETELIILIKDLAEQLCDASNRISNRKKNRKSGLLIIFDEVSEISDNIDIGFFFKVLTEYFDEQDGGKKISCILIGLPSLVRSVKQSNSSSSRVFNEIEIGPLSYDESRRSIVNGIYHANIANHGNNQIITMEDEVLNLICKIANGDPHLLQQLASSVFDFDNDWIISMSDLAGCSVYQHLSKLKCELPPVS